MKLEKVTRMSMWNPWHGCTKLSPGCLNCYVYRSDPKYDRDPSAIGKNACFTLPVDKNRKGEYKLQPDGDYVYTCFTSDFFHPAADEWRKDVWNFMKIRSDLKFFFITKRIDRFHVSLPEDWGEGYDNVTICCTCENQDMADYRLPIFMSLPIKHKITVHEPLLGNIDIVKYLKIKDKNGVPVIQEVVCGGESGKYARVCNYDWILNLRDQCMEYKVPFSFHQTGENFRKDGRIYHIPRKLQHSQAKKAGINIDGTEI